MRLFPHYQSYPWVFHEVVIDAKHIANPAKSTAITLQKLLKARFDEYDSKFATNSLATLTAVPFHTEAIRHKAYAEQLKSLYSYGAAPFSNLFQILTTTPTGEEITECPVCEVDLIGSLDHVVPRKAMPEFSTHPLNLIPVCTKCNGKKNDRWLSTVGYRYINPYLDDFHDKEYLRVEVRWGDNQRPVVKYHIFQGENVSNADFIKIKHHFHDLKLCQRYASRTSNEIGILSCTIRNFPKGVSDYGKRVSLLRQAKEELRIKGRSYWRGLLKFECARNKRFFEYLKNYEPI